METKVENLEIKMKAYVKITTEQKTEFLTRVEVHT